MQWVVRVVGKEGTGDAEQNDKSSEQHILIRFVLMFEDVLEDEVKEESGEDMQHDAKIVDEVGSPQLL